MVIKPLLSFKRISSEIENQEVNDVAVLVSKMNSCYVEYVSISASYKL